jgi:hypothetical protein
MRFSCSPAIKIAATQNQNLPAQVQARRLKSRLYNQNLPAQVQDLLSPRRRTWFV